MKKHKIVTKGVAFNILDPDQEELLNYAMKRKNFSAYVKRIISKDMHNNFIPTNVSHRPLNLENKSADDLNEDLMNSLI